MLWLLVPAARGRRLLTGLCAGEVGAGGVGDCSADAVGAGCVVVVSGVGGVGDGPLVRLGLVPVVALRW